MNRLLVLILIVSALLSAGYARVTPVGGAPDEGAHLEYVKGLGTQARLPALDMTKRRSSFADPNYEAHQPPLYYGLAVPFYHVGRAIGGENGGAQGARWVSILFGLAGVILVWTIARELLPGRPAIWALSAAIVAFLPMRLHVVSSVSNDAAAEAAASLSLLLMVRALTRGWTLRHAAGLGLAIAAAFLTKQSNLMLLPPALVILFLASRTAGETGVGPVKPAVEEEASAAKPAGKRDDRSGRQKSKNGGQSAGKERSPARAAVPASTKKAPGADETEWLKLFFKSCLVVGGIFVVLTGWWLLRNQMLYGDPLAKKAFDWYFADTPLFDNFRRGGFTFETYLQRLIFPTTFATFWGAFGHLDPNKPYFFMGAYGPGAPGRAWGFPPQSWTYDLLRLCVLFSLTGGVAYAGQRTLQHFFQGERRGAEPSEAERALDQGRKIAWFVLALHALFVVSVFLNFNSTYFQAQGRYLFPALGVLSLGLAAGWLQWGRTLGFALNRHLASDAAAWDQAAQKWERPLVWLFGVGMLALAVYALVGVLDPAFNRPPDGSGIFVQ